MKLQSMMPAAGLGGALITVGTAAQAQAAAAIASGSPIWIISVIGAVVAGAIALVGTIALKTMRAARESRNWPVAAGAVLSGDVQEMTERDSDGDTSVYYVPRLRYTYEVGGRCFESDRIRFGNIRESQKGAHKILERLCYRPAGAGALRSCKPVAGDARDHGGRRQFDAVCSRRTGRTVRLCRERVPRLTTGTALVRTSRPRERRSAAWTKPHCAR
jgi:hypothetical protein